MDFLATAATPIPSHTVLAVIAVLIGGIQLALAKGTSAHRWLGWVWVSVMAYVAISSFFISTIQTWRGFSPIHLLSAWTLLSLVVAVYHARRKYPPTSEVDGDALCARPRRNGPAHAVAGPLDARSRLWGVSLSAR